MPAYNICKEITLDNYYYANCSIEIVGKRIILLSSLENVFTKNILEL